MKKRLGAFFIILVLLSAGVPCTFADTGNSGFVRVETGEAHVVALKSDGTVWTWGSNMAGALGNGTERSRYAPAKVEGVDGIIDIAAGRGFSVALKSDGTVWGWGNYWV
jgi:hypothetical protein